MNFRNRILFENTIKYLILFVLGGLLWKPIESGLLKAAETGKLESIAVIMSIVSLSSITGYFAFSYTTVGKIAQERVFGYLATFFLGLSLLISLIINYNIAAIWVPEMQNIWLLVLVSLYVGTILFDNLDLLRLGMDVAATSFFEKAHIQNSTDKTSSAISFLKKGQRLPFANGLIGQSLIEIGKMNNNNLFLETGNWMLNNINATQTDVDNKVAQLFLDVTKDSNIHEIARNLVKGQSQHIADNLIATIMEKVSENPDLIKGSK